MIFFCSRELVQTVMGYLPNEEGGSLLVATAKAPSVIK
jgi:hypothetical protein